MENQKQQIVDRLKHANNILVTVSANPSVDQLTAAIGLTLALNKLGKHGIAVFSGQPPSTIEFLKPEETFEKNTDSLRDFIISLDKSKADKLRYKVEDQLVKIFITPYRTSLSEKDLEFGQGDFNVDAVVALGVIEQQDLDAAITSQGRILHDATVIDINTGGESHLGSLIWSNPKASSLCEMVVGLIEPLKAGILDAQMATALLTGIVAETERFKNEKTTPDTMQTSSKLLAAGANQQLVAQELTPPEPIPETPPTPPETELPAPVEPTPAPEPEPPHEEPPKQPEDGTLEVAHDDGEYKEAKDSEEDEEAPEEAAPEPDEEEQEISQIHIDEHGKLLVRSKDGENKEEATPAPESTPADQTPSAEPQNRTMASPPEFGGQMSATTDPSHTDESADILGEGTTEDKQAPILSHQEAKTQPESDQPETQTLAKLEEAVHSPHVDQARNAVDEATGVTPPAPTMPEPGVFNPNNSKHTLLPPDPGPPKDETAAEIIDPLAPPPVPPPMMPPSNFNLPPSDNTNSL